MVQKPLPHSLVVDTQTKTPKPNQTQTKNSITPITVLSRTQMYEAEISNIHEAYITNVNIGTTESINMKYIKNNGILKLIPAKPIVSTVRLSLLTHQNFEASTVYNARIDKNGIKTKLIKCKPCLLYTSPSPRDRQKSRMPSSA